MVHVITPYTSSAHRISLRRVERLRRHLTASHTPRHLPRPPEEILVVIRGKVINIQHTTLEEFVIKEPMLRLEVKRRSIDGVRRFSVRFVP